MPVHDELGLRMKEFYEGTYNLKLMRRTPIAIRIDGRAFHTYTKGFTKPFDNVLVNTMQETMRYLCENIQGCVLGYTQSDEITLILVDYKKLNSYAWFDNKLQKICSMSASMATMFFNKLFERNAHEFIYNCASDFETSGKYGKGTDEYNLCAAYEKSLKKGAMFDSRVFPIPKEEVTNLVYWRQLDAIRNSIQMLGQANFPHKELQNKTSSQIKEMLIVDKEIMWEDLPIHLQRGSCCIKVCEKSGGRSKWIIDEEIPIFKDEGREYIERLINY